MRFETHMGLIPLYIIFIVIIVFSLIDHGISALIGWAIFIILMIVWIIWMEYWDRKKELNMDKEHRLGDTSIK